MGVRELRVTIWLRNPLGASNAPPTQVCAYLTATGYMQLNVRVPQAF
jgi:hypothetical protein